MVTPAMRRALLLLLAALIPAAGGSAAAEGADPVRVAIFYYPWYGTPTVDGAYEHWQQRGYRPPDSVSSAFYPARGPYSSSDPGVLQRHVALITAAGIDQAIVSWWGRGSAEDRRLPALLDQARARGLDVAAHVEPYGGRTAATVAEDIAYLHGLGIRDFYLYGGYETPLTDWAELNATLGPDVRTFFQTSFAGDAAIGGFDGLYTYDVLIHHGGKLTRICDQARRRGLLCAPSVGPGYDARRAVADVRVKSRRLGATYDSMWRSALASQPDLVTITSFNEWHEGTQIEPARPHIGPRGGWYDGYDGAYGLWGRAAEGAYLARTAYWANRLR
jgi:glycoprotein endo-alpha-1,2-mannosidase